MKAIFFDLDGTLLHFTRDYRDVLTDTFRAVAGECSEEWLDIYDAAFFDALEAHEANPYQQGFVATGIEAESEQFIQTLQEYELEMCQPPENIHADLTRLAETFQLGVLTNGVPTWQRRKLDAFNLRRYFDEIVVSYETGAHKPEITPFRAAETRLPADSYAMVGDSDADINGAHRAGWTTHRYRGDGFSDLPDALDWD